MKNEEQAVLQKTQGLIHFLLRNQSNWPSFYILHFTFIIARLCPLSL